MDLIGKMIPNHGNRLEKADPAAALVHPDGRGQFSGDQHVEPTSRDRRFFWTSMAVLHQNWDIARWALGTIEKWSVEMLGLDLAAEVEALLTPGPDGRFPLSITYIDGNAYPESGGDSWYIGGPTAWAFTRVSPAQGGEIGLILPVHHVNWVWREQVFSSSASDSDPLCMATQTAALMLHEMVHIIGDGWDFLFKRHRHWDEPGWKPELWRQFSPFEYADQERVGSWHEDHFDAEAGTGVQWPCFDECRMVASLFMYGMAHRYSAIGETDSCSRMGDELLFAHSFMGGAQTFNADVDY